MVTGEPKHTFTGDVTKVGAGGRLLTVKATAADVPEQPAAFVPVTV
jgi:hypothetical protein